MSKCYRCGGMGSHYSGDSYFECPDCHKVTFEKEYKAIGASNEFTFTRLLNGFVKDKWSVHSYSVGDEIWTALLERTNRIELEEKEKPANDDPLTIWKRLGAKLFGTDNTNPPETK